MKMKRTLAGVAAGLVAVSAMATAVSADQETINLHYDLRTRIQTIADGTVTIIQTYENAGDNLFEIPTECPLTFGFRSDKLGKLVEARADFTGVEYIPTPNGNLNTKDFTESLWYADKDRIVDDFRAIVYEKGDNAYIDTNNSPADKEWQLVENKTLLNVPVNFYTEDTVLPGTTQTIATPTGTFHEESFFDVLMYRVDDTTSSKKVPVHQSTSIADPAAAVAALPDYGFNKVADAATVDDGVINGTFPTYVDANGVLWYVDETNTAPRTSMVPDYTYQNTGTSSSTIDGGHFDHPVNSLNGQNFQTTLDSTNTPVIDEDFFHFKKITVALTYEVPSKYWGLVNYGNWDVTGSYDQEAQWLKYFGINAYGYQDQTLNNLRGNVVAVYPDVIGTVGKISFGALATKPLEDHYFPLMSTTAVKRYDQLVLNPVGDWAVQYDDANKTSAAITTNDVIAAIRRSGVGTSPLSVLNDAIANDLDVQFTFTSAAGNIVTAATHARQKWTKFGESLSYDPGSTWSKTAFGQHLYSNKYNNVSAPWNGASFTPAYTYNASDATSDMYGSYSSAWAQNLISAGLVVNSELTMQLNDTKKLVWNENQLTFNWFDVTDETKITRANQILTTMLLYTPVDWYWDSLDVTVIEPEEEEDVNAGEGIEEDGEVLDEEIEEEEVEEEEVEEEEEDWEEEEVEEETEPEIEEVEVEETEAEVVEVAPVASPKTGNSPIALAVIPVALAAAAVVAKKRG